MITRSYNRARSTQDWREWSRDYWTAMFCVKDRDGMSVYKKITAPRCRQCRHLAGHLHWTGPLVCACGNPFINSSGQEQLPLISRVAAGIKPWDKKLTSRERALVAAIEAKLYSPAKYA